MAGSGLGINGEHHRSGVVPSVMLGKIVDAADPIRSEVEVAIGGRREFVVVGTPALGVDFHMGVNVDRVESGEVDTELVSGGHDASLGSG